MKRRELFQIALYGAVLISVGGAYSLKKILPTRKLRKLSKAIELAGKVDKNSERYLNATKLFSAANFNLTSQIAKDFKLGNVLNVNDWCLSVTECYYIIYVYSD